MYELAEGVFVEEATVRFYGFDLQTRMAVLVLDGRRLLLYSPVWFTPELGAQLEQLGEVSYVVAPNKIHNQTLSQYSDAYPDAELLAPPGLAERRPALRVTEMLDVAPPAWGDEVDMVLTGGNVFFTEAVLLHHASRTLLVGDLVEYLDESTASATARAMARLFGVGSEPVASPEFRFYTHDEAAAAGSFSRILGWDFERIFLCHGRLISDDANKTLRRVTDDLLRIARKRSALSRAVLRWMANLQ